MVVRASCSRWSVVERVLGVGNAVNGVVECG